MAPSLMKRSVPPPFSASGADGLEAATCDQAQPNDQQAAGTRTRGPHAGGRKAKRGQMVRGKTRGETAGRKKSHARMLRSRHVRETPAPSSSGVRSRGGVGRRRFVGHDGQTSGSQRSIDSGNRPNWSRPNAPITARPPSTTSVEHRAADRPAAVDGRPWRRGRRGSGQKKPGGGLSGLSRGDPGGVGRQPVVAFFVFGRALAGDRSVKTRSAGPGHHVEDPVLFVAHGTAHVLVADLDGVAGVRAVDGQRHGERLDQAGRPAGGARRRANELG